MKLKEKLKAGFVIVLAIGGIFYITCTDKIPRGHVGVVFDQFNNGVQDEVLASGRKVVMPWQKISEFPTTIKTLYMSADKREGSKEDESIVVGCNDGEVKADVTLSYSFNAEDVADIQRKYMGDGDYIINDVLRGQLRSWVNEATKKYSTMQVHITDTENVNAAITDHVKDRAKEYGVTIHRVSLSNTRPSAEVKKAIEQRQKTAQELERKKMELEKVKVDTDKAKLIAQKKLIEAEGERKANEEKAKGLTDAILKEKAIERWNGQPAPTMQVTK